MAGANSGQRARIGRNAPRLGALRAYNFLLCPARATFLLWRDFDGAAWAAVWAEAKRAISRLVQLCAPCLFSTRLPASQATCWLSNSETLSPLPELVWRSLPLRDDGAPCEHCGSCA